MTEAESSDAQWQKLIDDTIRQATENVAYEVERDAEQKVAAILRERGWTVTPPSPFPVCSDCGKEFFEDPDAAEVEHQGDGTHLLSFEVGDPHA